MNKTKLHASLIDMGVAEENDVVFIKERGTSLYITIVSGLNNVASYIYQNNELVIVEGNNVHVSNVLNMKDLNLEEFQ